MVIKKVKIIDLKGNKEPYEEGERNNLINEEIKDNNKDDIKNNIKMNDKTDFKKNIIKIDIKYNNYNNNFIQIINFDFDIIFGLTFLGRLIITIYSFNGLCFLYNFIFQYLALAAIMLYYFEKTSIQFILSVVYIYIAILTSNVLMIPTYEFISFPFINYKNIFSHLCTFISIYKDEKFDAEHVIEKDNRVVDVLLIFISILYLLGFILGMISDITSFKIFIEIIILTLIYIYYLVIFFSYFIISIYIIIILTGPFEFKEKIFPKINLLNYSINSIYKDNYKKDIEIKETFWDIPNISRLILFVILIIVAVFSYHKEKIKDSPNLFFHIVFIIIVFTSSIVLNFPLCYKNSKASICYFFNSKIRLKDEAKPKNPIMLPAIKFFCDILFLLVSLILCIAFFGMKEKPNEDFIDLNNFSHIFENNIDSKYNLLPSICNSKIYNMPIYLYIPFINDAYYYNKINDIKKKSSFDYDNYKKIFFNDNYTINTTGNLIENDPESVKMVRYDIENEDEDVNITILSIKGTSHKKDLYLDFQLFMPSVFLNLLYTFSIFGDDKDSINYRLIEYGLSMPYRVFGEILFIDNYIKQLMKAYNNTYNTTKKNIVIVGHSLGGGLSKILGAITKNQAISLSGPGINAFHTLWASDGKNKNFDLSFVDLVPDKDLIPRVEVSGGTIYRIFCNQSPFKCHDKTLSLCETLAMCRSRYYEFYCYKIANLDSHHIKEILKSSDLKKINN